MLYSHIVHTYLKRSHSQIGGIQTKEQQKKQAQGIPYIQGYKGSKQKVNNDYRQDDRVSNE